MFSDERWSEQLKQAKSALAEGKAAYAESLYRSVLDNTEMTKIQLQALDGLSRSLHMQGRLSEAEDALIHELEQLEALIVFIDLMKSAALFELSALHTEQGRMRSAALCLEQILCQLQKEKKENSPLARTCQKKLLELQESQNTFPEPVRPSWIHSAGVCSEH